CDGTNIVRLTNINPGIGDSNPFGLTVFQNALYFAADDGNGLGLWKYDGTNASRVGSIIPGDFVSFAIYRGALYLGGSTNGVDFEPWKFDGTNFTVMAQINSFGTNASPIFWTTNSQELYLSADDGSHGL